MSDWHVASDPFRLAVAGVVALSWCVRLARTWRRGRGWGDWAATMLLGVGLAFVVVALLQPERDVQRHRDLRQIVVLRDASGSMETEDAGPDGQTRMRRAEDVVRHLRASPSLSGRIREQEFGANPGTAEGTDIGEALSSALSERPAAVVLISDGDCSATNDPRVAARQAGGRGIPVYTVPVGDAAPRPAIRLTAFDVPAGCRVGDTLDLPFAVSNTLDNDWQGSVTLSGPEGSPIQSRDLSVPGGGVTWSTVRWRAAGAGATDLTLSVADTDGTVSEEDRRRPSRITVAADPIRVLLLDSLPRWTTRAARRALGADSAVALRVHLLGPAGMRESPPPGDLRGEDAAREDDPGGEGSLPFPTSAELDRLHVVILGDVSFDGNLLPAQTAEDLRRRVSEKGLGLILIPGETAGPVAWSRTALGPLLPVRGAPDGRDGMVRTRTAFRPVLVLDARASPLTALSSSADADQALWDQLPALHRYSRCGAALFGTRVLGVHPGDMTQGEAVPLLATRSYGQGHTVYLGSDELWRWQHGPETGAHDAFWRAAVRFAARGAGQDGRAAWQVFTDGGTVPLGNPAFIRAILRSDSTADVPAAVRCELYGPDGGSVRMRLRRTTARSVLAGSVILPSAGEWRVHVAGDAEPSAAIVVSAAHPAERRGDPARPDVMRAIAAVSGGRSYGTEATLELAAELAKLRSPHTGLSRFRLWSHPLFLACLAAALAGGWLAQSLRSDTRAAQSPARPIPPVASV